MIRPVDERPAFVSDRHGKRARHPGQAQPIRARAGLTLVAHHHREGAADMRLDVHPRRHSIRIGSQRGTVRREEFDPRRKSGPAGQLGNLHGDPVPLIRRDRPGVRFSGGGDGPLVRQPVRERALRQGGIGPPHHQEEHEANAGDRWTPVNRPTCGAFAGGRIGRTLERRLESGGFRQSCLQLTGELIHRIHGTCSFWYQLLIRVASVRNIPPNRRRLSSRNWILSSHFLEGWLVKRSGCDGKLAVQPQTERGCVQRTSRSDVVRRRRTAFSYRLEARPAPPGPTAVDHERRFL